MTKATLRIDKAMKMTDRSTLSLKKYFSDLNTDKEIQPLTVEEERIMFAEYNITGDPKIKTRIIKSNMKFVITVTKKFLVHQFKFSNSKALLEDLINEGNIGLINAFDKFDTKMGTRFLTFATWHIYQQMQVYLQDTLADIPQPANRFSINQWVRKATNILISEGHLVPSLEQIVERYNAIKKLEVPKLTTNLLAQIRQDKNQFLSSDTKLQEDSDDMTIADTFRCNTKDWPDALEMQNSTRLSVKRVLNKVLTDKEREIIEYTYGLNGREEKTLHQLSDITEYTRERIGQIVKGALIKLHRYKRVLVEAF